jgi:hypothetical protein
MVTLGSAQTARASDQILWWNDAGDSFTSFGPNSSITINTGTLDSQCDTFSRAANIYVVPSGSVSAGGALTDVSGTPNTVETFVSGGLFIDETIGFTAPSGKIGPGEYAVVYDECQNGTFDAGVDALFDPAIRVEIPEDVPDLPTNAFEQVKKAAGDQGAKYRDTAIKFTVLMMLYNFYSLVIEPIRSGVGPENPYSWGAEQLTNLQLTYACMAYPNPHNPNNNPDISTPAWALCPTASIHDVIGLQLAVFKSLIDQAAHWEGIAADPPNPNFQDPAELGPRTDFQFSTSDPVEAAFAAFGQHATVDEAASGTLLASLEKYQGADNMNDGHAALMHARNIKRYALLLADNMDDTNNSIDTLLTELEASGSDLEGFAHQLKLEQDRIKASGSSAEEVRLLKTWA